MREMAGSSLSEVILLSLCRAELMNHSSVRMSHSEITSTESCCLLMPVTDRHIIFFILRVDTVVFCTTTVWLLSSSSYPSVHKSQTALICSHLIQGIHLDLGLSPPSLLFLFPVVLTCT